MFMSFPGGNNQKTIFGGAPAFAPSDLGSTKLRLWLRPEGTKYTTSARSVVESGTGLIGSWSDESGNGFHANQATSGNRPTRRTNGGVTFGGSHWLVAPPLGAWTGNFVAILAGRCSTYGTYTRFASVNYASGWNLMNGPASGDLVTGVSNSAPPYGDIVTTATINVIHSFLTRRTGTTFGLAIDGGSETTATVTSAAIANTDFLVGIDEGFGYPLTGDLHEIIVVTGQSAGDLTNLAAYMAARASAGVWV